MQNRSCNIKEICSQIKTALMGDKTNNASRHTIIQNGGILENEVQDDVGLSKSGVIQRYWIAL